MTKNGLLLVFALVMGYMAAVEAKTTPVSSSLKAIIRTEFIDYRILSEEDKTVEVVRLSSQEDSVIVPETVTYNEVAYTVTAMADNSAYGLEWITAVSLPSTLKRIGKYAFRFCASLKAVTLPEGLEEVGEQAFMDAPIDYVHIPASVSHLGTRAFNNGSLKSITVAADNAVYDSREDCNAVIEKSTGMLVLGCNSTKIPASVKIIGPAAFYGCKSLTRVDLPEGLTSIGDNAFYDCTGLQGLELPHSLTSIGNAAFVKCPGIKEVMIPRLVEHIGEGALGFSENALLSVESDNPCYDSREDCNAIIETTTNRLIKGSNKSRIPSTVTSIGVGAFMSCTGVTEIDLPDGLTVIEGNAFDGCKNLVHVSLPQSLTTIGNGAFSYTAIIEMDLPSQVDSIGSYAFLACRKLERIKIPDTVAHFGDKVFASCGSLTEVNLPSGLIKVGQGMFSYCGKLSYVEIPSGVKNIEYEAFYHCSALQSINFPDGLESIGSSAFFGCSSLKKVSLPNTVRTISGNAFDSCTALSEVTLGDQVENIGWGAFQCSSIKEITLPAKLRECGQYLFAYCDQLTSITVLAVIPPRIQYDWGSMVPKDKLATVTLYVPAGSIDAYRSAAEWKNFKNIVVLPAQEMTYRPMIEDGKVWIVRGCAISPSSDPMGPWIDYCYLDGDTIIVGQTCKRMMCIKNDNPSPIYVGAWYEQDKKVYFAGNNILRPDMDDSGDNRPQFELLYDFTLSSGDNIHTPYDDLWTVNKNSGGITGFKGTYYDFIYNGKVLEHWFEGVGSDSWPFHSHPLWRHDDAGGVLLACIVGDDVIYYNSEEDDPYTLGTRKHRFDFTHTIKTQPKAPRREKTNYQLYGEYNAQQLGIYLYPLDEAYLVCITNESGNVVYEKAVNAGTIVGLNIDISAYPKGLYTVTVENSRESFIGEIDTRTTGIEEVSLIPALTQGKETIYDLYGRRLNGKPRKGVYIENGRKKIQ